jgi:hypothetical protein
LAGFSFESTSGLPKTGRSGIDGGSGQVPDLCAFLAVKAVEQAGNH